MISQTSFLAEPKLNTMLCQKTCLFGDQMAFSPFNSPKLTSGGFVKPLQIKMAKSPELESPIESPPVFAPAKSAEIDHPLHANGWAAKDTSGILAPFKFSRRATSVNDVQFKVLYCGVCHSDLHMVKNEWGFTNYPIVPGHEIVGVVTEVGSKVQKVKVGDKVGVGVIVGSCRNCESCNRDLENYCITGPTDTYNGRDKDGTITCGGYSDIMVADEHFIIRWPESLPLYGAPLLCAGITTYSPIRHYGLDKPGMNIGVAGLGGLGHVAVKFLKALGTRVTVISTSADKKHEAIEKIGADAFLVSKNEDEMAAHDATFDGILDCVAAVHPILPLIKLLKVDGKLICVGAPDKPLELPIFPHMITRRKMVGGSMIGGLKQSQEMIDFAAKHNIMPEVEIISMDYINTAMERLAKSDVRYRFVIDMSKK